MADKQTTAGAVPGAPDQPPAPPEAVMPPTPPGESSAAVPKTQAVADALVQFGDQADPQRVAGAVKAQTGIDLDPGEVATIVRALRERAAPPPPVQPPPGGARTRPTVEQRPRVGAA